MSAPAHTPVMAREALDALAVKAGGVYVDATFGAGGYTRAMLDAADCAVIAFDRDPAAIAEAQSWIGEYADRLTLVRRPFAEMEAALAERNVAAIDGAVMDIGVSSMQLDDPARGFSFRHDGPLSMRMDGAKPDAADIVAAADARQLAAIFKTFGEERHAARIARAIVRARDEAAIVTTTQLAGLIEAVAPNHGAQKIHPATRVFQALRIFVNDELGQLARALCAAERLLAPAGRLVVVTFHSLEDRMVKWFFAARAGLAGAPSRHQPAQSGPAPSFRLVTRRALIASADEIAHNPRARSAKLRAAERTDAPPFDDDGGFGAPHHPDLPDLEGAAA